MKLPAASCGYQSEIALKPTRLRPRGLRRGSPRHLCRAKALATADHSRSTRGALAAQAPGAAGSACAARWQDFFLPSALSAEGKKLSLRSLRLCGE